VLKLSDRYELSDDGTNSCPTVRLKASKDGLIGQTYLTTDSDIVRRTDGTSPQEIDLGRTKLLGSWPDLYGIAFLEEHSSIQLRELARRMGLPNESDLVEIVEVIRKGGYERWIAPTFKE
jgi:hypothetical protein